MTRNNNKNLNDKIVVKKINKESQVIKYLIIKILIQKKNLQKIKKIKWNKNIMIIQQSKMIVTKMITNQKEKKIKIKIKNKIIRKKTKKIMKIKNQI